MKLKIMTLLFLLIGTSVSMAQKAMKLQLTDGFVNKNSKDAVAQLKYLAAQTDGERMPRSFEDGKLTTSSTSWWTSGFFPGSLLYLYEATGDKELLALAKERLHILEKEKNNKGTHDLGFMLYCSFGNALRLTRDSLAYKEILTTGAESLASRYNPITKTILSWDRTRWQYPVIIDNMMNLEFLMQLSKITGDKKYSAIATAHANTTMANHFRQDHSSYHVVDYDKTTGKAIGHYTQQGAFDESAWARGQAWGLYGYVMMYRETKDKAYLAQAQKIAKFYLDHPNLPADLIPYWDFNKDDFDPSSKFYKNKELRDVSAAAIVSSALLELSVYTKGKEGEVYLRKAEQMLQSLSAAPYKAQQGEVGGFILKHSVGSNPHGAEVDVPLTYADYYYLEALVRYQRMLAGEQVIKQ